MNRKEREQVWGCTFSREQQISTDLMEIFEEECQLLVYSLQDFRLKRLSRAVKPESRSKAFVFPLEYASMKERLSYFVGKLFQPNPYRENLFFRGFYFTSGTQEGMPIDRIINAISKQFELPAEMIKEPEIEKKSYFIKDLFTKIIFPSPGA